MQVRRAFSLLALAALPLAAQPPQARNAPVLSHIHLETANLEKTLAFWTDVIGASTQTRDTISGVSMQGVFIAISQQNPTAPSAGSAIDHIGLRVPDLGPISGRLAKTSYKTSQPVPNGDTMFVEGPDGLKIEITEDSLMYLALEFGHVHFQNPNPAETQAWYGKHFGARAGQDDQAHTSRIMGAVLHFTKSEAPASPTAGKAIDHIAFELKDLAAFCNTLTANGLKIDGPVKSPVMLTDPSGAKIELLQAAN